MMRFMNRIVRSSTSVALLTGCTALGTKTPLFSAVRPVATKVREYQIDGLVLKVARLSNNYPVELSHYRGGNSDLGFSREKYDLISKAQLEKLIDNGSICVGVDNTQLFERDKNLEVYPGHIFMFVKDMDGKIKEELTINLFTKRLLPDLSSKLSYTDILGQPRIEELAPTIKFRGHEKEFSNFFLQAEVGYVDNLEYEGILQDSLSEQVIKLSKIVHKVRSQIAIGYIARIKNNGAYKFVEIVNVDRESDTLIFRIVQLKSQYRSIADKVEKLIQMKGKHNVFDNCIVESKAEDHNSRFITIIPLKVFHRMVSQDKRSGGVFVDKDARGILEDLGKRFAAIKQDMNGQDYILKSGKVKRFASYSCGLIATCSDDAGFKAGQSIKGNIQTSLLQCGDVAHVTIDSREYYVEIEEYFGGDEYAFHIIELKEQYNNLTPGMIGENLKSRIKSKMELFDGCCVHRKPEDTLANNCVTSVFRGLNFELVANDVLDSQHEMIQNPLTQTAFRAILLAIAAESKDDIDQMKMLYVIKDVGLSTEIDSNKVQSTGQFRNIR